MTKPEIGEVITAKYRGTCTRSSETYQPGAKIARDDFGYHLEGKPDLGGDIRLGGGSGYGCDGWRVGQVCWHAPYVDGKKQEAQVVVVTRAKATYYREDGLSFGVGDDRGYIYEARARLATDEEAAPLIAEREKQRAAYAREQALKRGLDTLFNHQISTDSNTPEGDIQLTAGRRLKIGEGFTLYGGGQELHVDADGLHVWHLRNNGMDGDNWGLNNVRTGGAGAIGTRYPLTAERRAFLDEHYPNWAEQPAPVSSDDAEEEWETL